MGLYMKLPKTITPCPIIESIIEVRFESELPGEAVFGIIYQALQKDFPKLDKLPILQIPEVIRSEDSNLIYSPHYKLSSEKNYISQIGPKVFSLANINEYVGWDIFYEEIKRVLKKIYELNIIKETKRFGLRYINLFPEMNIYERSNLKINLKEDRLEKSINLLINLPADGFSHTLRMVSDAQVNVSNKVLSGSIIDIDTALNEPILDFYNNMETILTKAHTEEKKLFFSLLTDEYIETLNPRR